MTEKEKKEKLAKAKAIHHKVAHVIGYISLGLLGCVLCLTASQCSKQKTNDNVQTNLVGYVDEPKQAINLHPISEYTAYKIKDNVFNFEADESADLSLDYYFYYEGVRYFGDILEVDYDSGDTTIIPYANWYNPLGEDFYLFYYEVGYEGTLDVVVDTIYVYDIRDLTTLQASIFNGLYEVADISYGDTPADIFTKVGNAVTGFATSLASAVSGITTIFYANSSLTFLGVLLCVVGGIALVYFAFRLIYALIKRRG